ncbi:SsrA-binding protein SmpB [Candidatus Woesebacteria bacterium]|nr:SsrA-binding protein SmpB [Candidatus Woesebacteria bacterium]
MKIINKKANYNYVPQERYEAGIALSGKEVKAFRKGAVDLSSAYGKVINDEMYLVGANFSVDENPARSRKLLLHRKEIVSILTKIKAKSLTLVPTKMYNKKRLIKLELALAKPKKQFSKKESKKRADLDREAERELRQDKMDFQKENRS